MPRSETLVLAMHAELVAHRIANAAMLLALCASLGAASAAVTLTVLP